MEDRDRELLRTLLRRPVLALAVIVDGEPCAGLVPFLADPDRDGFVVHVSSLARHTNGLVDGARVSAVIALGAFDDPLRVPRVHLEGTARVVARGGDEHRALAERWVARFPTSAQSLTLGDFRFVHVAVDRGRAVAGFGRAWGLAARALRELGEEPARPPVRTPFGARSTADEVLAGVDLSGKRFVVTGGGSGLGLETARALVRAGAEVTAPPRQALDLTDPASIASFVDSWEGPLHGLVANAGVALTPETRTAQGWELQLATNHLGHFALAVGLRDALASAGGRLVVVSSAAHLRSPVVFDDPHFRFRTYDPLLAYAQSKTANALFAVGAAERWKGDGIAANAVHPGAVPTGLQRHVGGQPMTPPERRKTAEQGAATIALLAGSPLVDGVSGRYFEDCAEAEVVDGRGDGSGVARYAVDRENADRLWDWSERAVGVAGG